ncbi:KOW domain-containing RNA-binding protein [Alkaliphilus serpentinus]|uniref:KOW domain-containing RNA-binding protein n=1 Tax=Alkaliphilus serpentinus TaxID=1482731 RepID=UPI001A9B5D20|nr:KOW domain-containing RNA-binding protein [Alkaliphilus serpentinus]
MEIGDFSIGQVVRSIKGRDQDKVFVVVGIVDDQHLLIADGDLRRIESPKKKKIKHLAKFNIISHEIRQRIVGQVKINNAFIRRELERLGVRSRD